MYKHSLRLHEAIKKHVMDLEESVNDSELSFRNEVDNLVKEQEAIKRIKKRYMK